MNADLSIFQLEYLLECAARLSTKITLINLGHLKPYLNRSQANQIYGRAKITKWLSSGMVVPIRDGNHSSAYRLDLIELESIDSVEKLSRIL